MAQVPNIEIEVNRLIPGDVGFSTSTGSARRDLIRRLEGPLPQRVDIDTDKKFDEYRLCITSAERDFLILALRGLPILVAARWILSRMAIYIGAGIFTLLGFLIGTFLMLRI